MWFEIRSSNDRYATRNLAPTSSHLQFALDFVYSMLKEKERKSKKKSHISSEHVEKCESIFQSLIEAFISLQTIMTFPSHITLERYLRWEVNSEVIIRHAKSVSCAGRRSASHRSRHFSRCVERYSDVSSFSSLSNALNLYWWLDPLTSQR